MRKAKSKSGFSMMEVVIALAVITVVTLASLTTVMASISARVKIVNRSEAQNFAQNVWECFKVSDNIAELETNVKFAEGEEVALTPNGTDEFGNSIYNYTSDKNNFTATITVDFESGEFYIDVIDNKDETIVSFSYLKEGEA